MGKWRLEGNFYCGCEQNSPRWVEHTLCSREEGNLSLNCPWSWSWVRVLALRRCRRNGEDTLCARIQDCVPPGPPYTAKSCCSGLANRLHATRYLDSPATRRSAWDKLTAWFAAKLTPLSMGSCITFVKNCVYLYRFCLINFMLKADLTTCNRLGGLENVLWGRSVCCLFL